MTVRKRILAIKLLKQQEKHPDYLKKLGIRIAINRVKPTKDERRN